MNGEAAVEITCDDEASSDFHEFWQRDDLDLADCEAEYVSEGTLTDISQKAYEASGYEDYADTATLYGLCASIDGSYAKKGFEMSGDQIKEATAMLVLCPDFPRAKVVKGNIALSRTLAKERASGVRFDDGSYRVGKKIKPGTYFISKADEGCYWERLDRRGNIIDNNFINARTRVEVTIRASDYTFHSEGCGEWHRR
jgi:hypothetical protein